MYIHTKISVILLQPKIILLLCLLLSLPSGCDTGSNKLPVSTPSFDREIIKAEHIFDTGSKVKALEYIRAAHNNAKNLTIQDEMNYYSYCNTIYMKELKDYDKCIEYGDSMLVMLEKSGMFVKMPVRVVQAYNIKADALMAKGLYNEAYDYYFKAKTLAKDNSDSCSLHTYSYSLGMVTFRQQKYREAAGYFKQSYAEAQFCEDNFTYFYKRQELLDNIGLSYGKAHLFDSAMVFYNKALQYIKINTSRFPDRDSNVYITAEAVVYGNMADVYFAQGKYDTAKALLNRSISANLKKGYTNDDAQIDQVKLANLYLISGNIDELQRVLQAIKGELDSIPNKYVELEWNRLMWKYYINEKDSLKASKYILAYIEVNDSITAANKTLMTSDIDGRVKSLERQQEIYLLEKDKRQQKTYLLIVVIIATMAIIIVFLVLRYSSKTGKNVKTLMGLNDQINDQKLQLENALKELEMKDKDKSRILRSLAHDVMSPISAVAALTDILITESEDSSEDHKEILNLIAEACNNSLNLSRDILDAAVTIAPGFLNKDWVNINKLLSGCVELLSVRANEKKQQLVLISNAENINAYVNREKIWRVINNLIMNAVKFSFENSVITVSLNQVDQNVVIAIKDTGIGIPEKNKHNVFDMFTESKMYGTSGEKPHGIGLSISLQVAKLHGGDIWFESEEGKGTTFYFSFPLNAAK